MKALLCKQLEEHKPCYLHLGSRVGMVLLLFSFVLFCVFPSFLLQKHITLSAGKEKIKLF